MDKITKLRPKGLPVHLPKLRKGLSENVNESYVQIVLSKTQHVQIFLVTLRTTTSILFSVQLKKEANLKGISSKTGA